MKTTIKQATINTINKVLRTNKKFYISSDFPFIQLVGLYLTYQAKVMNEYLREKGFTVVRANRNIWLKTKDFINYKK